MKNTRISQISTYFALAAAVATLVVAAVVLCVYFTLGPARSKNQPRTELNTVNTVNAEQNVLRASSIENWTEIQLKQLYQASKGNATHSQSKQSKPKRQAAAAAAEAEADTHTHSYIHRVAEAKRTNEWTARPSNNTHSTHSRALCVSAAKVSVSESRNRQAANQHTASTAATTTKAAGSEGRAESEHTLYASVYEQYSVRQPRQWWQIVYAQLASAARVCERKIICVFAVATTVMYQQIERVATCNFVQRACTVQSLNIGRALETFIE